MAELSSSVIKKAEAANTYVSFTACKHYFNSVFNCYCVKPLKDRGSIPVTGIDEYDGFPVKPYNHLDPDVYLMGVWWKCAQEGCVNILEQKHMLCEVSV